jgi:hypothetical protein
VITKLEEETHETIQYYLPRLAVALENLVEEKKRENYLLENLVEEKKAGI